MCGITAILKKSTTYMPPDIVGRMNTDISHRGPDDEGILFLTTNADKVWQTCPDAEGKWSVVLGSRRLSILDLSSAGHMPMVYQNRYWITYNGEVYNFIEIRAELVRLGHTFRSSSDTEVILVAYAEWGPASFERFRGMWGLVVFDSLREEVILCRDRLGIKPLYLWEGPDVVAIASEIKQFLHLPGFIPRINLTAATEYLYTGYEDPGRSFFAGVYSLPAGSWLSIPLNNLSPRTPVSYWYPESIQVSVTNIGEASRLFSEKLRECISIHLRSDVPVGCALSGGLDSSTIAILVNELHNGQNTPLHTFTSTFKGDKTDEREYVEAVISCIKAVPHYVTPDPTTFLEELDSFLRFHDEPVGSLSIYAGYCIARLTREACVPVTLNGQGGDEILSGYWQSYFMHLRELGRRGQILPLLRHFIGASLSNGNPTLTSQIPVMLRRYRARSKPAIQIRLRDRTNGNMVNMPNVLEKILALDEQGRRLEDLRSIFLPRLLKWDDRNSMAFSVEGRYPFLDHELIELCLSFAPQTLYHRGWTKWPLRAGLSHILPDKIRKRQTKFGFEVPQDKWLCGPLRPKLEHWLRQDRPLWDYIEPADAQKLAQQTWQLGGKREEPGQALFRLFIFDRWAEIFNVTR
jgi:asparagine synthase (glutamine-hydrolysing)